MSEIKITNHAVERYAERFKNLSNQHLYIADNKDKLKEEINKLYKYSEVFYEGQLRKFAEAKYYMKHNSVLVVREDCIITIFKIVFDLPGNLSELVTNGLIEEIKNKELEEKALTNDVKHDIISSQDKIEENKLQIELLQEQIEQLQRKNEQLEEGVSILNKDIELIQKEKYACIERLLGNTELKKDANVLRKIK